MGDFFGEDLRESRFERVDLSGSEFRASELTKTRFRGVDMSRVVMRGVEARRLDPALLHEPVDGEWSFIETLRHLVFATESWIRRAMLGDPSLDAVLELRRDRISTVREVIGGMTDQSLAGHTEPVEGRVAAVPELPGT